jgi:hypothetical protein
MVHYILELSVGDFGARSVDLIGIISAFEDTKTAHGLSQFSTSSQTHDTFPARASPEPLSQAKG